MKKKLPGLLIGFLMMIGLLILSYPTISNWYNQKYQLDAIAEYQENINGMKKEKMELELERARNYNEALTGTEIEDPFIPGSGIVLPENYMEVLNITSGIMGYVEVPDADIYLPIYHGTGDDVLKIGVGHMEMTAFPIGDKGNHTVLTGHTALPGALLFTNLKDTQLGDVFYIHILEETLAYKVNQILVVEPSETGSLQPVEGEDYVTLLTCTPYAVNSHRLLIRGSRISYTLEMAAEKDLQKRQELPYNLIITVAVLLTVSISVIMIRHKRRRERRKSGGKR